MKNEATAKKYDNEVVNQLMINGILSDQLYKSSDEIVAQIIFWQSQIQRGSVNKTKAETLIAKLLATLEARVNINYVVVGAKAKFPTVVEEGKTKMNVIKTPTKPTPVDPKDKDPLKTIRQYLADNKITLKMSTDSPYDELLNLQAYCEIRPELIKLVSSVTYDTLTPLDKEFFEVRGVPEKVYAPALQKVITDPNANYLTVEFYYNHFYRNNPEKFVEEYGMEGDFNKYLEFVWGKYEGGDLNFAVIASEKDKLMMADEIASQLIATPTATSKDEFIDNLLKEVSKSKKIVRFGNAMAAAKKMVDHLFEKFTPSEIDNEPDAAEAIKKFEENKDKVNTPNEEDNEAQNVVSVEDITQSMLSGIAIGIKKREIVESIITEFLCDENKKIVETVITEPLEGKVDARAEVRRITPGNKNQANDFLYKLYRKLLGEYKRSPSKAEEVTTENTGEATTEEYSIDSINEVLPVAKKMKAAGKTNKEINDHVFGQIFNRHLKEQEEGSEFKDEKKTHEVVNQLLKGLDKSSKDVFKDHLAEVKDFIKAEIEKDKDISVANLKERVSFFLEENNIEDDNADIVLAIKSVVPEKFNTNKVTEENSIATPVAWVEDAVNAALEEGVTSGAQLAYKVKKHFKKVKGDLSIDMRKEVLTILEGSDFIPKMKAKYEETKSEKGGPGPVQTEEIKTEEPAEDKKSEPKFVEKISVKYPKLWAKVLKYTTLDQLLEAAKWMLKNKGEEESLALSAELIAEGNITSTENWTEEMTVDWFEKFVNPKIVDVDFEELTSEDETKESESTEEVKTKAVETKSEEAENIDPILKESLEQLSKSGSRGAFRKGLQEIISTNGDTNELRNNIIAMIKKGKGSYTRKIKHNTDNDLHAMINKAVKNVQEQEK